MRYYSILMYVRILILKVFIKKLKKIFIRQQKVNNRKFTSNKLRCKLANIEIVKQILIKPMIMFTLHNCRK